MIIDRLADALLELAGSIDAADDLVERMTHDVYLLEIRRDHGRKSSFWSKYGK